MNCAGGSPFQCDCMPKVTRQENTEWRQSVLVQHLARRQAEGVYCLLKADPKPTEKNQKNQFTEYDSEIKQTETVFLCSS